MDLVGADHHDGEPGIEEGVDDLPVAAFNRDLADAGAENDPKARARLLASTNHTLTTEILGMLLPPDVHQQRAAELAETLDEIDQRPDR